MSVACRLARQWNRGLWSSAASLSKNEDTPPRKEWYSPQIERKKESWNVPPEKTDSRNEMPASEWRGMLHYFQGQRPPANIDVMSYLHRGVDLRPSSIKRWWSGLQTEAAAKDQMYKTERVSVLGFDLAAAHFIVHRGGKVRFKGAEEWVQQDEDGKYELARHYQPGVFVEEIDASGMKLLYEGLESMTTLQHLKSLNVSGCLHINDWCIDRICREYSSTLQHLNLSGCVGVTHCGVAALARLRHLRTLDLHGLEGVKDIRLLCLLLCDTLPELKISGINYLHP